jgi:hypothetical protein
MHVLAICAGVQRHVKLVQGAHSHVSMHLCLATQALLQAHPEAAHKLMEDGALALHVAAEFHAGEVGEPIIDLVLAAAPDAITMTDFSGVE